MLAAVKDKQNDDDAVDVDVTRLFRGPYSLKIVNSRMFSVQMDISIVLQETFV